VGAERGRGFGCATGHRREEDHRLALHACLEAVERADVLAAEIDVHERRELAVLEELPAQVRIALGQVLEDLADVLAGAFDLALAPDLCAKRRRDPDDGHVRTGPAQNST
jgi:hypothetical protein